MHGFGVVLPPPEKRATTDALALAIDRAHDQLTQSKETTTQIHPQIIYVCVGRVWSILTFRFALPSVPGATSLRAVFVTKFAALAC